MTTIHKHPLRITRRQSIVLPLSARILTAQMQGETLCLWALFNVTESSLGQRTQPREIEIIGTGNPADKVQRAYIATVQTQGFVWHVFERV